ncbi:MAG TPA: methylated-DNA--[protein]-cysteine S-methyltransferase [Acidobacteriota bacterium]|nr:methylated-DNA--[protein]-cysteine S-methyltransferase [Acidobacteriota bacterium]
MKKLDIHSFKTRFGTVRTAATGAGLALVSLPGESARDFQRRAESLFGDCRLGRGGGINKRAEQQIAAFLEGRRRRFSLPLDLTGTAFQKKVLRRVARIPYGSTMTYGDIARAVGHPAASRAVGAANARNALPLVIPCHRVVSSTGLGGYGGGVELKKKLLRMEGAL